MFKNSGDVVYLMFVTVAVVAALVLLMQAICKRWFPYILKVPSWYMYSALLVICLNSLGDGVRDALDPRLRGEL